VAELLALPPDASRGTHAYSNGGFVIAGAMLEEVTGEAWESLLTAHVLAPLGMTRTGFGPPGTVGAPTPDQPWGHVSRSGSLVALAPGPDADNPAAIGPAGTVHATFSDLARYLTLHLDGERGMPTRLLTTASFARLHQAAPGTDYALGWGVAERSWAGGRVLQHHGSNGYWWASVWLAPERDLGLFAVTNAGGDEAFAATDEAVSALIRRRGL
jgi:CubicO group peptidase (beta-lactamase class C family)